MLKTTLSPGKNGPICDFCSAQPTPHTYIYVGGSMVMDKIPSPYGTVELTASEDWAACETCHQLIQADDWDGLLKRAEAQFYTRNPSVPHGVGRSSLKGLYDRLKGHIYYQKAS